MSLRDLIDQAQLDLESAQNYLSAVRVTLMEARREITPTPLKRLEVQWIGQNTNAATDDYSNNDCGAAAVAMVANYRGIVCTVDNVSAATGRPRGFSALSFSDLVTASSRLGLPLKYFSDVGIEEFEADIEAGNPAIALVDYRSLPATNRYDARYNGGHYLVIVGAGSDSIVYHDPYWPSADNGAFRVLTRSEFEFAYTTIAKGNTRANHSLRLV